MSGSLTRTLFYAMEQSIKSYRQFAQASITREGLDITVDQWLVLKTLQDNPGVTQQQVGITVFKDFASITRIVELLRSKGFLHRGPHPQDGRRSTLTLTARGEQAIETLQPIINSNRRYALAGLERDDIARAHLVLTTILANTTTRGPDDRPMPAARALRTGTVGTASRVSNTGSVRRRARARGGD